jgi:hypothetical protein
MGAAFADSGGSCGAARLYSQVMDAPNYHGCRRNEAGAAERLVPAIVLIGIGLMFLLNNLHIVNAKEILRYWPAVIIAVGIVKLVDAPDTGARASGGIIVGAGCIFMARSLGYLDVGIGDLWPLILIALGLMMLFDRTSLLQARIKMGSGATLRESALFSGGKRFITDQNFTSAKYDAVFGGFELDLRKAEIVGESAVLEMNAVFGGIEAKIPESWEVVLKGAGVFGAFQDSTQHPDPRIYPNPKKLIVKGGAVFGGVEIKN